MNLYRGLDAPRPSAEKLSDWEYQADFIYRAQVVERTSTRPLAKAIQNDVNHAQRILVLIAELERVREERDEAQESYRAQGLALDSWIVGGQRRDEEVKTLKGAIRILNGRLDAALLQRDEALAQRDDARESVKAAVKQRDRIVADVRQALADY